MRSTVRVLLSAAVVTVAGMSGGTVYASQAVTAPPPVSVVAAAPTGAGSSALQLPVSTLAADSIAAARSAVDDALAAEAEAAAAETAQPRYACEPAANARVIDGIIVNKDCPGLNAAKEQAQREYATSGEAQYDYFVNGLDAGRTAQENALRACREQTGMTTAQCQEDAAAGNAN